MSVPEEPGAGSRELRDGRHGHGGRSSDRATLAEIGAEPADILVIGGGITGAGVARDAAMRGLRTVLVEQQRPRVGHQLALQPADSRRPSLPRDRRSRPRARGQPRAPHPSPHRAAPRLAAAVRLSAPPRRPDRALAAGRGDVAVRCAGAVPQCAVAPDAGQARHARRRADAAGARPARRRAVLRRAVRRCPPRARDGALRHPSRRAGGQLHCRCARWSARRVGWSARSSRMG